MSRARQLRQAVVGWLAAYSRSTTINTAPDLCQVVGPSLSEPYLQQLHVIVQRPARVPVLVAQVAQVVPVAPHLSLHVQNRDSDRSYPAMQAGSTRDTPCQDCSHYY